MCLDCGCGRPHDTHGDPRHIVLSDLLAAAAASGISPDKAAANISQTLGAVTGKPS